MMVARIFAAASLAGLAAFGGLAARAEDDSKKPAEVVLRALPRVPSRAALLKDIDLKDTEKAASRAKQWVDELIKSKEKRANEELEVIKKKLLESESARLKEQKERMRRREMYDRVYGVERGGGEAHAALRIKLSFVVLELDAYQRIAELYRAQEALATDIVTLLPKLDRDGDGRLAEDEYRDAAGILASAGLMFQNLDANEDGFVSEAESNAARKLPGSAADAAQAGRMLIDTPGHKIKNFDANSDGALDVAERKMLSDAFLAVAIQAGREAGFYRALTDALALARKIAAAKFEDVELTQ
jgi:hypothetical protein